MNGVLENSQGSFNTNSVVINKSGNQLTMSITISFKAAFAGQKNVYLRMHDIAKVYDGFDLMRHGITDIGQQDHCNQNDCHRSNGRFGEEHR